MTRRGAYPSSASTVESAGFLGEHGLAVDVTLANGSHIDVRMAC